jgi:hypothetical protein
MKIRSESRTAQCRKHGPRRDGPTALQNCKVENEQAQSMSPRRLRAGHPLSQFTAPCTTQSLLLHHPTPGSHPLCPHSHSHLPHRPWHPVARVCHAHAPHTSTAIPLTRIPGACVQRLPCCLHAPFVTHRTLWPACQGADASQPPQTQSGAAPRAPSRHSGSHAHAGPPLWPRRAAPAALPHGRAERHAGALDAWRFGHDGLATGAL